MQVKRERVMFALEVCLKRTATRAASNKPWHLWAPPSCLVSHPGNRAAWLPRPREHPREGCDAALHLVALVPVRGPSPLCEVTCHAPSRLCCFRFEFSLRPRVRLTLLFCKGQRFPPVTPGGRSWEPLLPSLPGRGLSPRTVASQALGPGQSRGPSWAGSTTCSE